MNLQKKGNSMVRMSFTRISLVMLFLALGVAATTHPKGSTLAANFRDNLRLYKDRHTKFNVVDKISAGIAEGNNEIEEEIELQGCTNDRHTDIYDASCKSQDFGFKRNEISSTNVNSMGIVSLKYRGGDVVSGRKTTSAMGTIKEYVAQVKPATRAYMLLIIFCTLVHIVGLPAPNLFALDITKLYEFWRPITAMAYLGGPSMSMANNLYFLVRYGQSLEEQNGTGEHVWFLMVQTAILSLLGVLLGFPFQGQAMVAAAVYVSSHIHPMERMPFQFGMMITSWQLPFCMAGIDCLSQQNLAAAWPHALGIFSGHCYHFFTKVWPNLGGKAWLQPPKWIIKKLGGKPASNVAGLDFRSKQSDSNTDKRKKSKKSGNKGRKLGGLTKK